MEINIEEVIITNFQSHVYTRLSFVSGINMIVGQSNNGKSAILRAIEWALNNVPHGTEFITTGKEMAEVTVVLSNGYKITRRRSRSNAVNQYVLEKDGNEEVFSGFGGSIPPQIEEARGMNRIEFNFSKQLDAPFLISDSPKTRAQTIGNLDELGKIDRALQSTNDDVRDRAKRQREMDSEIKKLKKERNEIKRKVDEQADIKERLSFLTDAYKKVRGDIEALHKLKESLKFLVQQASAQESIVAFGIKLHRAWDQRKEEIIFDHKKLQQDLLELRRLSEPPTLFSTTALSDLEKILLRFQQLHQKYALMIGAFSSLLELSEPLKEKVGLLPIDVLKLEELIKQQHHLQELIKTLKKHHTDAQYQKSEGEKAKADFVQSVHDFAKLLLDTQVCPFCLQDTTGIDTKHIHHHFGG